MDRRTRNVFAVILVAVIALTGGAALILGSGQTRDPNIPANALFIDGVVVDVDARSLTDVPGFDLRTAGGEVITFDLTDLRNGADFPRGHLSEHMATATPIDVWYRIEGGVYKALWVVDAP